MQNRSTEGCSKLKSPKQDKFRKDWSRHYNTCKNKTNNRNASPKVGQDQVSGGVSVLCWHAEPVANVLWKPRTIRYKVKFGNNVQISNGQKLVVCLINGGCHCIRSSSRLSCNIRERGTSYCLVISPYRP